MRTTGWWRPQTWGGSSQRLTLLRGYLTGWGYRKNGCKTVGRVCSSCQAARVRAYEAYIRWMTGKGRSFKERQRERVLCPSHCQTHHCVAKGRLGQEVNKAVGGNNPRTYRMAFPEKSIPSPCPVEGCSGQASTQMAMRMHFWQWHFRDTMVILEEGNLPHPRCPLCDMLVPWRALNGTH